MNHKKSTKNMTPAELSASAQERFVADHRKHHRMVTFMRFFIPVSYTHLDVYKRQSFTRTYFFVI